MKDFDISKEDEEKDFIRILAIKINLTNVVNHNQFISSTKFDVEEPKTYSREMHRPHATKWAKAMEEKLDQLHKNKT